MTSEESNALEALAKAMVSISEALKNLNDRLEKLEQAVKLDDHLRAKV